MDSGNDFTELLPVVSSRGPSPQACFLPHCCLDFYMHLQLPSPYRALMMVEFARGCDDITTLDLYCNKISNESSLLVVLSHQRLKCHHNEHYTIIFLYKQGWLQL